MAHFDLDAARAARRAVQQEPSTFTFGGEEFTLPLELPLDPTRHLTNNDVVGFVAELLGEDQWERMRKHQPTLDDLLVLARFFAEVYGVTLGELPASNGSSPDAGNPSRPTSNGSTKSTSRKPAGARKR